MCEPSASKKPRTRTDTVKHLKVSTKWTELVGNEALDAFPVTKLPNNRAVMRRYHTLKSDSHPQTSNHDFACTILLELKEIWSRAYIPIVSDKACLWRIKQLLDSWKVKRCRSMTTGSAKETKYISMLNQLCDLAPAEEELLQKLKSSRVSTWQDDYQFYLNMKCYPQVGSMQGCDKILEKRVRETQERKQAYQNRVVKETLRQQGQLTVCGENVDPEEIVDSKIGMLMSTDNDPIYQTSYRQKRSLKTRPDHVLLELPTRNLAEATAVLSARLKLSTNSALTLFAKIIQLGHGDIHDFIMSRTTIWRQRIIGEKKVAEKIFEKFQQSLEGKTIFVILQWDGKKVKYQSGAEQDRLCIVLHTLPDGRTQFIGAPRTPDGSGDGQCEALIRYADLWGVALHIVGMIWDTTSSNTGRKKGSGILFEKVLDRAILYLACRHHVDELHVHWADQIVRGVTKGWLIAFQENKSCNEYEIEMFLFSGPDDGLFMRFKASFSQLDLDDLHLWVWPQDLQSPLALQAKLVLRWAEKEAASATFPRADYRELCEILIAVLGGQVSVVELNLPYIKYKNTLNIILKLERSNNRNSMYRFSFESIGSPSQ